MIDFGGRGGAFARMFGSAIVMQALLSATNLAVGLILIRRTTDEQYGYYVLTLNVIILVTALQNAFIQTHLVVRMTGTSAAAQADLIGGVYRDQRRLWPAFAALAVLGILLCRLAKVFDQPEVYVALAALVAVLASLFREFFRMVLLAFRKPGDVLRADVAYAILLIVGVMIATLTPAPAIAAAGSLAVAAIIGGLSCHAALWRWAPWNIRGAPGILVAIAPLGFWTAAGSAIHWLFSQGYNFLVAGMLGVGSVAAISATRILIMPVNLLSTGIGNLMLPTISNWLHNHSAPVVLKRQMLIAGSLATAALCYFALLWVFRDWLFLAVLKKDIAQRDQLLMLWYGVGLLMLLRDQFVYLLLSRSRFRILTVLTFVSALIALCSSYVGIQQMGAAGALVGVLFGEIVNVGGLLILSLRETKKGSLAPV